LLRGDHGRFLLLRFLVYPMGDGGMKWSSSPSVSIAVTNRKPSSRGSMFRAAGIAKRKWNEFKTPFVVPAYCVAQVGISFRRAYCLGDSEDYMAMISGKHDHCCPKCGKFKPCQQITHCRKLVMALCLDCQENKELDKQ